MFKIASLVAILTVFSKILGLVRDLVIANYFGTSMQADAFNIAYLLTGNFFIILGGIGGPFYSSMVAILPKIQAQKFTSTEFIKQVLKKLFVFSCGFAFLIFIFKEFLLKIFIDAQESPEYFQLALKNIDILLALVVITAPVGIIFACLNCFKKYLAPSLAPALVNIVLIAILLAMGDSHNGLALAIGTSIGGVLSLLIQIPFLKEKAQNLIALTQENLSKYKKDFYILLIPALLSTFSTQIMVFIDSYFCKSLAEGSWTAITISNRLIQMPLGVLLTAFLVPVFPKISQMIEEKRFTRIKEVLTKSLAVLIGICIPGIIISVLYPKEIIAFIFERGAFDANSTLLVSQVFVFLVLSMIPFILRDSFTRTLYCFNDSKSPFYVMLVAIALKITLNAILVPKLGISAIAITTVASSCFNAFCLFFILKTKFK